MLLDFKVLFSSDDASCCWCCCSSVPLPDGEGWPGLGAILLWRFKGERTLLGVVWCSPLDRAAVVVVVVVTVVLWSVASPPPPVLESGVAMKGDKFALLAYGECAEYRDCFLARTAQYSLLTGSCDGGSSCFRSSSGKPHAWRVQLGGLELLSGFLLICLSLPLLKDPWSFQNYQPLIYYATGS